MCYHYEKCLTRHRDFAHTQEMVKINVPQITIVGVRKIVRKMSRATSQGWVILRQEDCFHIMTESQYDKLADKDEFEFVELITRIVR